MNIENCSDFFAPFQQGRLFVGFSGGADSTAALLVCRHFAEKFRFTLTAVHVNHHLRGAESDREERDAGRFAARRGIDFLSFQLTGLPEKNCEAAARAARMEIWKKLTAGDPLAAVVLGHHADDAVETLLLRLARGANVSSAAALRPVRKIDGVTILRPLLGFSRSEIEAYLKAENITAFACDSSNGSSRFRRNFFRNELLPAWYEKMPGARPALRRSVENLICDAEFIESCADREYASIAGQEKIPLSFWRALSPALAVRVLRRFLSAAAGAEFIPPSSLIGRFQCELKKDSAVCRRLPLSEELSLEFSGETLRVCRGGKHVPVQRWHWCDMPEMVFGTYRFSGRYLKNPSEKCDLFHACFDAAMLPEVLRITGRRSGDRIIPFGRKRPELLRKLRIDRKLPAECDYPVLRNEAGEILWAPGIRHSALGAVSGTTKHIFCIKMSPEFPLPEKV